MAVVGVDLGCLNSKIGVARHRGIDIIANETSNRATPSLVAFGPRQRAIGEAAKTQETSNFANTIGQLKRIVGRTLNDPEIQNVEKKFMNNTLVDVDGSVGVEVKYLGEKQRFSATQLVGAYLAKIRDTAGAELKNSVNDIVIAVPGWYTDIQRRAVLDAAAIANLNVLRLINETTATALGYGITKTDLPDPEATPRHVLFVDVGHSSMSASLVAFSKGQLTVKGTAYDRNLGGRDIDYALVKYFSEEFKTKYKIDVLSNPKAVFRLTAGCEKLKKVLSANSEAPINVESIMNDIDATSKLTREELEGLISELLDRIPAPLQKVLEESGLELDQIDSIELTGGSTRIPSVRARIQSVFPGKALSTTLNQDEAVARGATFACAKLSPVFRVRDFNFTDIATYPIKMTWTPTPTDPDESELEVFPKGNALPSSKILSFHRSEPFDIEAYYSQPEGLPGGINPWIGKFTAKEIPATTNGETPCVKLKSRLNAHGILSFEAAYVEEAVEREEAMDVDSAPPAPEGEAPKKKKVVKKTDVRFVTGTNSLDKSFVEKYKELEGQMEASDKLVTETEDRKNALEEYVYDMRSKVESRYAAFVKAEEKEKLLAALSQAEDWLYSDEGEDATKSAYVSKLDELKVLGDPIYFRWHEAENRSRSVAQLRETLNSYMSQATSGEERFNHIDAKDLESVVEKVATVQKWLEDQTIRQTERPKNEPPVLTTDEISKKRDEVIYFATPILTKPKPKIPTSGTQTPKEEPKKEDEGKGPSEMDVD